MVYIRMHIFFVKTMTSILRNILLVTLFVALVLGTGEWSEDAEDLGEFLFLL